MPVRQRDRPRQSECSLAADAPTPADVAPFRRALIRIKKTEQALSPGSVGRSCFLGGQLFRANLHFPANVPTGSYLIEVMLVRDGEVVSAQTTPLVVSKIGVGADIFDSPMRHSAAYGVVAILGALLARLGRPSCLPGS